MADPSTSFAGPIGAIVLIDLTLSGDNAVVIGMAAHRLPERQRRAAILLGATLAVVLRVALTAVAAWLLQVPFIKLVGGLLLAWVAFKLLKQEEDASAGAASSESFREAVQTIVIADFIMSVDNILGVAAASHGSVELLVFGLVLSMAIMMFAGSLVASVLDRFWWLAYAGSGVVAWIACEMILTDRYAGAAFRVIGLVEQHSRQLGSAAAFEPTRPGIVFIGLATISILAAAHYIHRHRSPAA